MKRKILIALVGWIYCHSVYALHRTYLYDISTLTFKKDTDNFSVYERVVWPNSYCDESDFGMPELPVFHHCISIADNIIVDSVCVCLSQGLSGILINPIKPHQPPTPTEFHSEKPYFEINENIYQKNEIFPRNCLINYSMTQARDNKFLYLEIMPFQYNPYTNEYTAYSCAEVNIFTHERTQSRKSARNHVDIGIPYYEYIIITSPQLCSAFEPFAQWKRAKGYNIGIVSITDILDNIHLTNGDTISGILDDAGKLRQYLIYSYDSVQTKYVLMGGDMTVVPIRYAMVNGDSIPSDFYYSELNCNWDLNNNGKYGESSDYVDYGAELYVGRLLCNSAEEVHNWTRKVLQYEINPGNGDYTYLGRALLSQEDQMQHNGDAELVQQKLLGHITCTIINEQPSYDAPSPIFPTGSVIIDSINSIHYGLLGNCNHGGPLVYGVASTGIAGDAPDNKGVFAMDSYDALFSTNDEDGNGFDNLINVLYPSVMYSTSCKNIPFDQYKTPAGTYNLGRVYTCRSYGGGPAYIGNTRNGYTSFYNSPSACLQCHFLDSSYVRKNNHIGIAEAKSKFGYQHNYLRHSHNLLGCPEMSLYTQIPSVFDNISVNFIDNNLFVTVGVSDSAESRICLSGDINGMHKQFVYTDRGNVVFDTIPEIYTLVVSVPNYIPYILTNDTCFLQNQTITDSRTYNGCNTFNIGFDITPLWPYGSVAIENGGDVVIHVGEKVIIKNNFEVKVGGHLIIH